MAGLKVSTYISLSLNSQRCPFLCLPSVGWKVWAISLTQGHNLLALLLPKHESLTQWPDIPNSENSCSPEGTSQLFKALLRLSGLKTAGQILGTGTWRAEGIVHFLPFQGTPVLTPASTPCAPEPPLAPAPRDAVPSTGGVHIRLSKRDS